MSWLFSLALVEEYSGESFSGGEPFAPSNLMPTPRPFLCSDKTMEFSPPSPFGLTLKLLTVDRGEAVLMSFLAAFPVRTLAPQDSGQASKGSDPACGWKWPASFTRYDPASRSWKTRQSSLLGDSTEFSETWPRWGSMRDGECSVQPTPALPTYASASGSWPTPKASAAGPDFAAIDRGKTISLQTAVAMWPTPHGFSKDGRSNGPSGNELGRAVNRRTWPTPNASDNRDRGNMDSPCIQRRIAKGKQIGLSMAAGGSLNPPWVEWLMGWVIGWTDLKPLGTDKFLPWLHSHGER